MYLVKLVRQSMAQLNYSKILYRHVVQATTNGSAVTASTTQPSCDVAECRGDPTTLTEIKGVIFDMDGTLTLPVLDFAEMRRRLNLAPGVDMLPTVLKYPAEEREKAMAVITELEEEGIKRLQLQPGVLDLLHYIAERGLNRAVITRNSWIAANNFLDKLKAELSTNQGQFPHLQSDAIFSQVITRDFQPCKPDPAAVFHICEQWAVPPSQVAVVGDDRTDMMCGRRAGTGVNVLLRNERNKSQVDYSDFAVDNLSDIVTLFATQPITVKRDASKIP